LFSITPPEEEEEEEEEKEEETRVKVGRMHVLDEPPALAGNNARLMASTVKSS